MIDCQAPDIEWPTDDRHQTNGITVHIGPGHKCGLGPGHANLHRCRCGVRSINANSEARHDTGKALTS